MESFSDSCAKGASGRRARADLKPWSLSDWQAPPSIRTVIRYASAWLRFSSWCPTYAPRATQRPAAGHFDRLGLVLYVKRESAATNEVITAISNSGEVLEKDLERIARGTLSKRRTSGSGNLARRVDGVGKQ
jgi:hypothetical protein